MTNSLPNEILNRIMRFNSHPTADIIRPYINKIKSDCFFNRDVINITRLLLLDDSHISIVHRFDFYVLSRILTHKYNVKYINDLTYKDDYIKRICRFKWGILLNNDILIKRIN